MFGEVRLTVVLRFAVMTTVSAADGEKRPARVGIVGSRGIPNRYGGFERFVELLVAHPSWNDRRFRFVVYGETPPADFNAVTTTRQIGVRKSEKGLQYYARGAYLASRECDIVISLGAGISIFSVIPFVMGKRLIVNPDGAEWKRTKWSPLGRLAIRSMYYPALFFADRIVIDAEALRTDFPSMFRHKMTYIAYQQVQAPMVTDDETALSGLGIEAPFMLVIARLEPENNIEMIVDGYLRAAPGLPLIVVGATTTPFFRDHLEPKQAHNVRFVGAIYDQSVLNALRARCSAYIHGHSVGGTNPSLLEALAGVKGRLFCHDNKYNREVAGERAQYFADEKQLSALVAATPAGAPDAAAQAVVFDDERYRPSHIAEQYREIFASLSPGAR